MKELLTIQTKLKVAKDKRNDFLKANFRSAEDILREVKPFLEECKCTLILSDEIIAVGNDYEHKKEWNKDNTRYNTKDVGNEYYKGQRFYVKATATLTNEAGEQISTQAFAREDLEKAGVDVSQVTGSASSYARKYALDGLFALDDGKDEDVAPVLNPEEQDKLAAEFKAVIPLIKNAAESNDIVLINNEHPRLQRYEPYVTLRDQTYRALRKNESV